MESFPRESDQDQDPSPLPNAKALKEILDAHLSQARSLALLLSSTIPPPSTSNSNQFPIDLQNPSLHSILLSQVKSNCKILSIYKSLSGLEILDQILDHSNPQFLFSSHSLGKSPSKFLLSNRNSNGNIFKFKPLEEGNSQGPGDGSYSFSKKKTRMFLEELRKGKGN